MATIRRLEIQDKASFSSVMGSAYPGFRTEFRDAIFDYRLSRDDALLYGAFVGERMAGSYRRHSFTMNLRGTRLPISGLGGVAVDVAYKKQHVCLEMVRDFHRESLLAGKVLATLYPFRTDFYAKMGYGLVSRLHAFTLDITDFPKGDFSACAAIDDPDVHRAYYNRKAAERHGLFLRTETFGELGRLLGMPAKKRIGVWREGRLTGACEYAFVGVSPANPFHYELELRELLYDTPEDLRALLHFVRAQDDQVRRVRLYTFDPDFALALDSMHAPVEGVNILDEFHMGETLGYGLMARVLDVRGLCEALGGADFNQVTAEAVFELTDDLHPENSGRLDWVLENGRLATRPAGAQAPKLALSIADFSALICGSISLSSLWRHARLGTQSPELLPALDRAFFAPPFECWTIF